MAGTLLMLGGMMTTPTLIYCAKKNLFAPIAVAHGFKYGAQLPNTVYERPYFADQNYKRPRKERYLDALAKHQPALATVIDFEHLSQLNEVLEWAAAAAGPVSEAVIIIPKCVGAIDQLPRQINGRAVRLGFSVPTSHGGISPDLHAHDFMGWPIHLLGGNPLEQIRLTVPHFDERGRYVALDVRSVDCNYIQKSAVKWNQFLEFSPHDEQSSIFGYRTPTRWRQLKEVGLGHIKNAPYEAFRRSCEVLPQLWAAAIKSPA